MTHDNKQRITESLRNGEYMSNPHQAAEDAAILAGEFSYTCSMLESLLQKKPSIWNELRKSLKSDTSAERAWEATPDGINEITYRLQLKSLEKMISALRGIVKIATEEAKNTF